MRDSDAAVYVVMGVSGSGKSTIGQALADEFGCPFYDGDDFHPPENVAKMAQGIPLTDADRAPWLERLRQLAEEHLEKEESAVIACSALKQAYRRQLRVDPRVRFIYLAGDYDLIWQRMQARPNHYMRAGMLQSQFESLEPPGADEATTVSIDQDVDEIVQQIRKTT